MCEECAKPSLPFTSERKVLLRIGSPSERMKVVERFYEKQESISKELLDEMMLWAVA